MAAPLVRRTTAAALVAGLAALSACGGGSDGPAEAEEPKGIPLPSEVKGYGTITEPALEARWLEESTGTGESMEYESSDTRSGTILLNDLVVTYNLDIISAVDRRTGKSAWRSDLDMEGQVICDITEPSSPDTDHLTVVFGDRATYCDRVARIAVQDGRALQTYEAGEDERSIDRFVGLATHDGTDYLAETYGAISVFDEDQEPKEVYRIKGEEDVDQASLVDDQAVLVVLTGNLLQPRSQVLHGISLDDMTELWRHPTREVLPPRVAREGVVLHPSDGRFVLSQTGAAHHLMKLDPATGELVGRIAYDYRSDPTGQADQLFTNLVNQENAPETFGRVGDDVVLNNSARGLSRVSMDGTIRWTYKPNITLREGGDDPLLAAGPVTSDGRAMLATVTNGRSADLLLLDTRTGKLKARWVVPEEYVAGFAAKPYLRLVGDEGVLMARNLTLYGKTETFDQEADTRKPYDAGYFTFPRPEKQPREQSDR